MEVTVKRDHRGYAQVKPGARYAGVGVSTFRKWLKSGLPFIQLPTGTILVSFEDIDRWMAKYRTTENRIKSHVDRVFSEIQ